MNKEYEVVYCKDCQSIKITDSDKTCLVCNGTSEVIGFTHEAIQNILKIEREAEDNA
jgi:hypothetical protein